MVGTEILGLIGTVLIMIAYVPQMRHIVKEHCAGGISARAWLIWLVATILILIHAVATMDLVFKVLQVINLVAITIIIGLIYHYDGKVCHSKEVRPEVKK